MTTIVKTSSTPKIFIKLATLVGGNMQKILLIFLLSVAAFAAGCATQQYDPATQAKLNEIQRTIPTCSGDKECNAKWETAQLWVVKNAGYKIQNATNVLIQTYNATGSRVDIAAQITKEPLGGGRYQFIANIWCDNIFGCRPNRLDALMDFNRTLNAVQP